MPLYEFSCKDDSHPRQEHFLKTELRDAWTPTCGICGGTLKRLPGGHGSLYFEEGRPRSIQALGDRPITSPAQERRELRERGLVYAGNDLPPGLKKRQPKAEAMKRFRAKDHKSWL